MHYEPRWENTPETLPQRKGKVLRVESPTRVELYVLSSHLTGVFTHAIPWGKSIRTYPCTGSADRCWFDHSRTSCRWQGWLAVQKPFGHEYLFVALTPAAYRDATFACAKQGTLRGRVLWLARVGMEINSRLHAILGLKPHDDAKLLPEPDVAAFLRSLWGLPHTWPDAYRNLLPTGSGDDEPQYSLVPETKP